MIRLGHKRKMSVLLVEDCSPDALVAQEALVAQGFNVVKVTTGAEAVAAATIKQYDILVLDYLLPDMTADQMIEKLRAAGVHTPFVMVAGTGNEEIAVAMMKLGAIDYITKKAEFPVTLSVVLQRYIRTSREQRQQHIWSWVLLSASALLTLCAFTWGWQYHVQEEIQHHRLQVVSDMVSSDGRSIVVLGPDGKICEWADSMETLLGWKWDEVKGCTPDFMMTTDNACRHKEAFKKAMELETPGAMAAVDCWCFRKDGTLVPVHINVTRFKNGRGYYAMALFTDPTKIKRIELTPQPPPEKPVLPQPVPGTERLFK